jgi:hypothetical protein
MAEDTEYEVKAQEKKAETMEALIDEKIQGETPTPQQEPPVKQSKTKGLFPIKQIPTDKVFKTLTNKDMMMQTLHDETMEPHVHLVILLVIIFFLAIIITLIGMAFGI